MPRPLRIDYPGAIHHVSNRGAKEHNYFYDESDRAIFREYLRRYVAEYGITIYAYALMDSHFHIALESDEGRLSDFMQAVESEYARYFNQKHGFTGHQVERRYFSELVSSEKYFKTLIIYILTNPQRAGLTGEGQVVHSWTSISEAEYEEPVVDWPALLNRLEVELEELFNLLKNNTTAQQKIEQGRLEARRVKVIGDEDFLENVLAQLDRPRRGTADRGGPISPSIILDEICDYWGFAELEDLIETKRDQRHSRIRFLAFYLLKIRAHLSVTEIAEIFEMSPTAVSKGIRKFKQSDKSQKMKKFLGKWG